MPAASSARYARPARVSVVTAFADAEGNEVDVATWIGRDRARLAALHHHHAPHGVKPGQLADQGLADPSWVLGDGPEDRLDRGVADRVGKLVEVAQALLG